MTPTSMARPKLPGDIAAHHPQPRDREHRQEQQQAGPNSINSRSLE